MLEEDKALRMRLHSLTIFRGLLEDPVVSRLAALLHAQPSDAEACADAYCAFAAALYERGGDLSTYLLKAVLEDENLYVRRAAFGAPIPAELAECLQHELCFLQELSKFDGAALRGALKGAFLPRWGTQTLDFAARYEENIRTLPLHGYGIYAKYHVFTVHSGAIVPVRHPDPQRLDELSGYERERGKVIANTRALLEGRPASNVLLYGDAGTGKSSTVKAVANAFADEGLRLIEVKKNQLYQIPDLVETLSANPLKFILFIDDLSFSTNDNDFAALKAILEGSVSSRSSNLAVYATSNRRHLIKETWKDREDMEHSEDLHRSDTMEEKLSLVNRFGLSIFYAKPNKEGFNEMAVALARRAGITPEVMTDEEICYEANRFEMRGGGLSGRTAQQFANYLLTIK